MKCITYFSTYQTTNMTQLKKSPMEKAVMPENMDVLQITKASMILRAINHPLRQKMLRFIHQKGKANVTEIYIKLRLEQSVTSQHLAILRKAGFVTTERDGKQIFYTIDYNKLKQVQEVSRQILEN